MQHAASSPNELRVASSQFIYVSHAVAMPHATVQKVAHDLDSGVRMRSVADSTPAFMPVVVNEYKRTDGVRPRLGKRTEQTHLAIINDGVGGHDVRNAPCAHRTFLNQTRCRHKVVTAKPTYVPDALCQRVPTARTSLSSTGSGAYAQP